MSNALITYRLQIGQQNMDHSYEYDSTPQPTHLWYKTFTEMIFPAHHFICVNIRNLKQLKHYTETQ